MAISQMLAALNTSVLVSSSSKDGASADNRAEADATHSRRCVSSSHLKAPHS
jgi:hypothetical protein